MDRYEIKMHVRRNGNRIEVGNSQLDIIIAYINDYFNKAKNPNKKDLVLFLSKHNESLELGNSQFDILSDIIQEYN